MVALALAAPPAAARRLTVSRSLAVGGAPLKCSPLAPRRAAAPLVSGGWYFASARPLACRQPELPVALPGASLRSPTHAPSLTWPARRRPAPA